jgi:hypothetical protein
VSSNFCSTRLDKTHPIRFAHADKLTKRRAPVLWSVQDHIMSKIRYLTQKNACGPLCFKIVLSLGLIELTFWPRNIPDVIESS